MARRQNRKRGKALLEGELRFEDDLGGYAVVRRAIERGSLIAAARSLGLDKTSVLQKLGRLETRLGVRLLERTSRRLRLTPAGQAFLDRYGPLVEQVMAARSHISGRPWSSGLGPLPPPAAAARTGVAAAVPAGVASAAPAGVAAVAPPRLDLVLRQVEGLWAAVCLPGERICVGQSPAEVLTRMAAALDG